MESNPLELIRSNRMVRVAAAIMGTLLLGALGSGLWELVLRDVLAWAGNITLSLISAVWGGYVDALHRDIGKLYQDSLTWLLFALAVIFLIGAPWLLLAKVFQRTEKLRERIKKLSEP